MVNSCDIFKTNFIIIIQATPIKTFFSFKKNEKVDPAMFDNLSNRRGSWTFCKLYGELES